eukprot:Gb_34358 [translate_table: standard]
MKIAGALICITVVVLDVVAGILGIEGEMSQNKVRHIRFLLFECRDPSYEAFRLGVAAASVMLIAHIIANVAGGCICFGSREELERSPVNKQVAAACLVFAWILLVVGFSLLIMGAISNSKSREFCSITRHNFLAIGGVLCFIHGALSAAYYVAATTVPTDEKRRDVEGVSMANTGHVRT